MAGSTGAGETSSAAAAPSASATTGAAETVKGLTAATSDPSGSEAGKRLASGQTSEPETAPTLDGVRVNCLMNTQYHAAREAYLDGVHRWFMFGIIALGAGAILDLSSIESVKAYAPVIKLVATASAAVFGALDLTFDLSNRARMHALLRYRYYEVAAEMDRGRITAEEAQSCVDRIAADEEPVFKILLLSCWNAAQEMVYGDRALKYILPGGKLFWRNVIRFTGSEFSLRA